MQDFQSALSPGAGGNDNPLDRPYRMTATLTAAQKESLQELATKYKVSVAWLIRQAIDRFIEEASGGPRLPFHIE